MKKFGFLTAAAILCVSLCSGALAVTLSGIVYFHADEPAPCTDVLLWDHSGCVLHFLGSCTTDSCGYYEFNDLTADRDYYVTVEFDEDRYCATAGWTGDCSDDEIECTLVHTHPFYPVTNKDWYLDQPDCDNVGCD